MIHGCRNVREWLIYIEKLQFHLHANCDMDCNGIWVAVKCLMYLLGIYTVHVLCKDGLGTNGEKKDCCEATAVVVLMLVR